MFTVKSADDLNCRVQCIDPSFSVRIPLPGHLLENKGWLAGRQGVPAGSPAGPCWFTGWGQTDSRAGSQASLQAARQAGRRIGVAAGYQLG